MSPVLAAQRYCSIKLGIRRFKYFNDLAQNWYDNVQLLLGLHFLVPFSDCTQVHQSTAWFNIVMLNFYIIRRVSIIKLPKQLCLYKTRVTFL